MNNFRAICFIPLICLITLVIGCTSTDDPVDVTPPVPSELSGTVGADGGTLTSSNGLLSITIPEGALAVDTGIGLGEIELTEVDAAFGDAVPRAALELLPADLILAHPAEITYNMSISTGTAMIRRDLLADGEPGLPNEDEPVVADFIIGAVKSFEVVLIPDQATYYNLKEGVETNVKTTVEVESGGQIVFASPLESLGALGQFATILGPEDLAPSFQGIPTSVLLELTLPGETILKLSDTYFEKDPEASDVTPEMGDGTPWVPVDTTVLDDDKVEFAFTADVIPDQVGTIMFGLKLGGGLELVDPSLSGLPLGEDPEIGELDFSIEMPFFSQMVEIQISNDLTIETGMTGLKDLAVAFGTISDPAPLGEPYNRWLYVVGNEGVKYYRLAENIGKITSVDYLNSITGLDNMEGVLPVSTNGVSGIKRELFIYGISSWKTSWNSDTGEYGMMGMVTNDRVFDAVGYGGMAHTPGLSFGRGTGAYFLKYNAEADLYTYPPAPGGPLFGHLFPGDYGALVSCFVHDETLGALVIEDGLPGVIWYHSRDDIQAEGTLIGITGNEPQQIRGAGGFFAISNYISNTLTTFNWGGMGSISNVSSTPVGIGPEGIDVTLLGDATPLVVSTGADVDYTLSHFSISGTHLKSVVYNAPASCTGPRYAVFFGSYPNIYIALSCHDSGTVEIIEVDLEDFE